MEISTLIDNINIYFELFPIEPDNISNHFLEYSQASKDIELLGAYAKGNIGNSYEYIRLVEKIVECCNDDDLEKLINEYGEDSEISQLIRKKRIEKYRSKILKGSEEIKKDIEKVINEKHSGNPFYEKVCMFIDEAGYKSDSEFYNAIGMPRQLFARLRDSKASLRKKTVLWIIIGLKLDYNNAKELLALAGYSFRKNDKKDVIISYILRSCPYDIFTVNEILDYFGLEPFC